MRVLSVLNVKGGVGKTTTSSAFAYILSQHYYQRVLLVDLDKQANTTKIFGCFDKTEKQVTISELLVDVTYDIHEAIKQTQYKGIDVIPSDFRLIKAGQELLMSYMSVVPNNKRLIEHITKANLENEYDFIIFDCPTDVSLPTINALIASDDVITPILIDSFSFSGMEYVFNAIDTATRYNPNLKFTGSFVSMYMRTNLNKEGMEKLKELKPLRAFETIIRHTTKVRESTFANMPINDYDKNCNASKDYEKLVKEYLERINLKLECSK